MNISGTITNNIFSLHIFLKRIKIHQLNLIELIMLQVIPQKLEKAIVVQTKLLRKVFRVIVLFGGILSLLVSQIYLTKIG
jgi:hypothetical protein